MTKLTEKYVQNKTLTHSKEYYKRKQMITRIFSQTEAKTKYKNKPGRADGLIAFQKKGNRIYTVSFEAKSHKTFNSLKNIARDTQLLIVLGCSTITIAICSWFVLGSISWWLKLLLALSVGLVIGFLITFLFLKRELFDTNGIILQVNRYPADEKWIAISVDAYKKYSGREGDMLLSKAKASGIGVIVIGAGERNEIKVEAKPPKVLVPRSYIYYYSKHKTIIDYLTAQENWNAQSE